MNWKLPPQDHRVFERNPLVAVIVELRYHPILKVPAKVADYQETVRARFPAFQQLQTQTINLGPGPVQVRPSETYCFAKPDESAMLSLSTASLSLESRKHARREQLLADVKLGLDALLRVYGELSMTRLGLRYVNLVDKERVSQDLGRPSSWQQLISSRYLAVPADLAELEGTLFACEVASGMPRGAQVVRYGLIKDADDRVKFRLDVDRYVDGPLEPGDVIQSLDTFADDIFAVFFASLGPDLIFWMDSKREGS